MGDGRLLETPEKGNVLRLFFCFLRNSSRTLRLIASKLVRVLLILPEPRIIYEEGRSDMYVCDLLCYYGGFLEAQGYMCGSYKDASGRFLGFSSFFAVTLSSHFSLNLPKFHHFLLLFPHLSLVVGVEVMLKTCRHRS